MQRRRAGGGDVPAGAGATGCPARGGAPLGGGRQGGRASPAGAALVALARSFEAPDAAVRTLEPFMETRSDELGLWFNGAVARVRGEAFRVDALRRKLSKGSHCEHVAIARSCVAELGPDVAAARAASAASHADWQAELAQAEKECAGLPRVPGERAYPGAPTFAGHVRSAGLQSAIDRVRRTMARVVESVCRPPEAQLFHMWRKCSGRCCPAGARTG